MLWRNIAPDSTEPGRNLLSSLRGLRDEDIPA